MSFKIIKVNHEQGEICPACREGKLKFIHGKFGDFLGCTKYPECHYSCKFIKSFQKKSARRERQQVIKF